MTWLTVRVAERADAEFARCGCRRFRTRHRGAAFARRGGRWRRIRGSGAVDHGAEAAQSGLRYPPQQHIVGRGPRVAAGLAGRFLAAEAQRALLVAVIDVPDP